MDAIDRYILKLSHNDVEINCFSASYNCTHICCKDGHDTFEVTFYDKLVTAKKGDKKIVYKDKKTFLQHVDNRGVPTMKKEEMMLKGHKQIAKAIAKMLNENSKIKLLPTYSVEVNGRRIAIVEIDGKLARVITDKMTNWMQYEKLMEEL